MNKSELIDKLAGRLGDHQVASAAVDNLTDLIYRSVARGESVTIAGFGTFSKVARAPRTARNPRTGEPVKVRKSASAKFKPGQRMRAVVKGELKLGHERKPVPMLPSGVIALLRQPAVREVVAAHEAATRTPRKALVKVATVPKVAAPVKRATKGKTAPKAVVSTPAPAVPAPSKAAKAVKAPSTRKSAAPVPVVAAPTKRAYVRKTPVAAAPVEVVKTTRKYTRRAGTTKATAVKTAATVTATAAKAAPRKPRKVAETNPARSTVNKMRAPKVTVIKTATKAPAKRASRKVAVSAQQ